MTDARTCQVDGCAHPIPTGSNTTTCPGCQNRLTQALAETSALETELNITITRQNVSGDTNGRTGTETPLPYHQAASDALTDLLDTLTAWANRTGAPPARHPARRLLNDPHLHQHPEAHIATDEILTATRRAWHVIDRAPEHIVVGPCWTRDCPEWLYAKPDTTTVTCRGCTTEWEVQERRNFQLDAILRSLATTRETRSILLHYGIKLMQQDVSRWEQRGQITPHGHDERGIKLYLVGDLHALAARRLDKS